MHVCEIAFQIESKVSDDHRYLAVNIKIDGRWLIDHIKHTLVLNESSNTTENYVAIECPSDWYDYYLGRNNMDSGKAGNKTILLDCECGVPGCWPLVARIVVEDDVVRWIDFEQTRPANDGHWRDLPLEGFTFDKTQYIEALKSALSAQQHHD